MDQNILANIEKKLTGDMEQDFAFIMKEATHFHKLEAYDMVDAIMKLFNDRYGAEGRSFVLKKLSANLEARKKMYMDAVNLIKKADYLKAQELIVKLIDTFPINRPIKENQILLSFNNLFENLYYSVNYNKENKEIVRLEEPYANYYFHLAYILFNEQDYEEALKMIDKALIYNPLQIDAIILSAECYYAKGEMDLFFEAIDHALLDGYNRFQLANAYYLLARYFNSIGDKKMAQGACMLSKNYLVTENINNLQKQIDTLTGEALDFRDVEAIKEVFHSHKIQFGPSAKVLATLSRAITQEKQKDNTLVLYYLLSILYDITRDPSIKNQMDELKPKVDQLKTEIQNKKEA